MVPNTYRNRPSGSNLLTRPYTKTNYSSKLQPHVSSPTQFTNSPSGNSISSLKGQQNVSTFQSQNYTLSNHQNNSYHGIGSNNVQYLGIPDRSSSPYLSNQERSVVTSPARSSSPNLFENKEYGGTMEQIRNRFTSSPKNKFGAHSSPSQPYPLLEDLKNVSESEIRRNKKGYTISSIYI